MGRTGGSGRLIEDRMRVAGASSRPCWPDCLSKGNFPASYWFLLEHKNKLQKRKENKREAFYSLPRIYMLVSTACLVCSPVNEIDVVECKRDRQPATWILVRAHVPPYGNYYMCEATTILRI